MITLFLPGFNSGRQVGDRDEKKTQQVAQLSEINNESRGP